MCLCLCLCVWVALDVLEHANHAVGAGREEPRLARVEDGTEDALAAHHAVAPEHLTREGI